MKDIITIGEKYELFDGSNKVIIDSYGSKVLAFIKEGKNRLFYNSTDISHSGIPLCFPNFGPLVNNKLIIGEQEFIMNQHGFARDSEFMFVRQTDVLLELKLLSNAKTKKIYPFDFEFTVIFELMEQKLLLKLNWKNMDKNTAPLSPGVHPYFKVNNRDGIILHTNALKYNLSDNFAEVEEVISSDYLDVCSENSFVIKGAPDINLINHNSEIVNVGIGGEQSVQINYKNEDFNRLTIWRKNANADYICIEPANAQNKINESPYLILPGECWESEVGIIFK